MVTKKDCSQNKNLKKKLSFDFLAPPVPIGYYSF